MASEASCPTCGAANPAEARFCMSCGSSLARTCPSCGAEAPPEARFCMSCGEPVAQENGPERAVRAAFGMQAAMTELNSGIAPEFGFQLPLRIGVNTGEVLAGRVGEAYTVVGDTVNVAARLQAAAPAGGILAGERTRRSSEAAVRYEELPPLQLKGKADPVPAWRAIELREADQPGERPILGAALVGRQAELSQLETIFERVQRDGAPHLVTVVGQAGVGKSRLLLELEQRLARREVPIRLLRGRCLAFGSSVVYWPLAEMLRAECGIHDGDTVAQARFELMERRPSWSTLRRMATTTFLEPLAPGEVRELIEGLLRSAGAVTELPEALAERSGGNPLFAEAMVQRIAEEGSATAAELPDTV